MISPHAPQTASAPKTGDESLSLIPNSVLLVIAALCIPALLAYLFSVNNEWQVFAMVVGIVGGVLIMALPHMGLAFFTALLYSRTEESVPELAGMRLTLIVSLIMLVAMWISVCMSNQNFARSQQIALASCFGILVVISALTHGNTMVALEVVMKLVALVFLILNVIRTPARYQGFIDALIGLTVYLAVYSIYLFLTGQTIYDTDHDVNRSVATGIFNDPNDLAATIVAGFALALVRIVQSRGASKLIPIVACGIMLWAVMLTNSRSGLMAMMVVIIGFFLLFSRYKSLALAMAGLFAVAVMLVMPSRMSDFDSADDSANSRFEFWQTGLNEAAHNPITGIGFGGFNDINGGYTAHNSVVLCVTEIGYPGFFCWMGLIFYAFRERTAAGQIVMKPADGDPEKSKLARSQLMAARLALARSVDSA